MLIEKQLDGQGPCTEGTFWLLQQLHPTAPRSHCTLFVQKVDTIEQTTPPLHKHETMMEQNCKRSDKIDFLFFFFGSERPLGVLQMRTRILPKFYRDLHTHFKQLLLFLQRQERMPFSPKLIVLHMPKHFPSIILLCQIQLSEKNKKMLKHQNSLAISLKKKSFWTSFSHSSPSWSSGINSSRM